MVHNPSVVELSKGELRKEPSALIAFLVGGAIAGLIGGGSTFALFDVKLHSPHDTVPTSVDGNSKDHKADGKKQDVSTPTSSMTGGMRRLEPIVTNLAAPSNIWIRLEAAIILAPMDKKTEDTLVTKIAEDFLGYLRATTLPDLQGASGLRHLREDLEERLAIRSKGEAHDVAIYSLVIQ